MNRFTEAPLDSFKFWGVLSYFTLCVTDNWPWLTSLHYPQTFSWANLKFSTLNMFSKVPRAQIKKVINFIFWSDVHWYGLALFLHDIDELKCYNSILFKLRPLKWGGKSFFSHSVKNVLGMLLRYSEAVVRRIRKMCKKTTLPESLFKQSCRRQGH